MKMLEWFRWDGRMKPVGLQRFDSFVILALGDCVEFPDDELIYELGESWEKAIKTSFIREDIPSKTTGGSGIHVDLQPKKNICESMFPFELGSRSLRSDPEIYF